MAVLHQKWRLEIPGSAVIRSEKSVWLTIVAVELVFVLLTRVVLARYWTYSLDAELIRTPLRLAALLVYWLLLRQHIGSNPLLAKDLASLRLLLALVLFLSVPLLVGDMSGMAASTKTVYAATSIVVALKEEIAFRALIQNLLARRCGNPIAILLATVLFTAYHVGAIPWTPFAYGQVIVASVLLGIVYARTRSPGLVIWLHALYDAFWSLTPLAGGPLLPYHFGLLLLVVATLLVGTWGRENLRFGYRR